MLRFVPIYRDSLSTIVLSELVVSVVEPVEGKEVINMRRESGIENMYDLTRGARNFWSINHGHGSYSRKPCRDTVPIRRVVQEKTQPEPEEMVVTPKEVSRQQQAREYMQDAISSKGIKRFKLEDTTDASLHILMALLKSGKEDLLRRIIKGGLSNYEYHIEVRRVAK